MTSCSSLAMLLVVLVLSLLTFQVSAQLCVSTAGSNISSVIGQLDITGTAGATGPNTLNGPTQATFDPSTSKVYVADANSYYILRFASAQAVINNGSAELTLFGNTTNGCDANILSNNLEQIDVYNDNLFIADAGNNRVLILTGVGAAAATITTPSQVLGATNFTVCLSSYAGLNEFNYPSGVAITANGSLFVAVYSDNVISRFDNVLGSGNYLFPNATFGTYQTSGTNTTLFNGPYYATVDRINGHLWVSEFTNSRVIFFSSATTKANGSAADVVLGQQNFTGPIDTTCDGQHFQGVYGVYYDSADDVLFVGDTNNNRVLYFNGALALTNFPNASGVVGFQNTSVCSASGSNPESEFGSPYGVFYANDFPGIFLLVADNGNNRVARFECANATFTRSPSLSNSVVASSVNPSSLNPSSVAGTSAVGASSSGAIASSSGAIASSSGAVANSSVLASVNASVNASSIANSQSVSITNSDSNSVAPSLTASPTSAPSLSGTASNSQSNTPSESNPNPLTASNTPIAPPPAGKSIQPAVCGNGNVETGEECDPGSAVPRTKCCTSICTNLPARSVCGKATSKCTKRPKCAKVLSSRQLQCQAGKAKKVGTKCGKGGIFSRKTCKADGSCSK